MMKALFEICVSHRSGCNLNLGFGLASARSLFDSTMKCAKLSARQSCYRIQRCSLLRPEVQHYTESHQGEHRSGQNYSDKKRAESTERSMAGIARNSQSGNLQNENPFAQNNGRVLIARKTGSIPIWHYFWWFFSTGGFFKKQHSFLYSLYVCLFDCFGAAIVLQ